MVIWNLPCMRNGVASAICHSFVLIEYWITSGQFMAFIMFFSDKAMKILKPFLHERIFRKRTVLLMLIINQISPLIFVALINLFYRWDPSTDCTPPNTFPKTVRIVVFTSIMVICSVLLIINIKILHVIHQHKKQIMVQTAVDQQNTEQQKNTRMVVKILSITSLFSFLSYLPQSITILANSIDKTFLSELVTTLMHIGQIVWMLNYIVDPIAVIAFRTDIRRAARNVLQLR